MMKNMIFRAIHPRPTTNDTKGFVEYFGYVNSVTDGIFFSSVLLAIFVIVFVSTKQFKSSIAWTIASFVCAMLAIPLAIANLVAPKIMYLFIAFVGIGAVWLKLETNQGI